MPYVFRLPDIGEGVAEGEVVEWFVKEGAEIREDSPLVSVLTDKANVEIPSPKTGKVLTIHAQVGEKVKVGGPLVTIETGSAEATPAAPAPASAASPRSAPVAAPPRATLLSSEPVVDQPADSGGRVLASPYVRRRANEMGVDLSTVVGSGPGGRVTEADLALGAGPRPVADVMATPPVTPGPAVPAMESELPARIEVESEHPSGLARANEERIPIRGIRRAISEHMSESVHRAAHFTYVEEVDATELVHVRDRTAKHVEKHGVKLSYLPFVIKAVVAGLREQPTMNALMDDAKQELVVRHDYHIGVATAAPEGLLVPVVHDADQKSIRALATEVQQLSEKARSGKLSRPELTGGTFTITSLGSLGGVLATPILNYPQVGILGVHKISKRPVVQEDGHVGVADMMNLSVSLDHRVLDGIIGARFLQVVKSYLEDPHQMLAELA